MTKNYMKNPDMARRFKHLDRHDFKRDDDYDKFRQEVLDTQKMSHILKNINSPMKKRLLDRNGLNSRLQASSTNKSSNGRFNLRSSSK